jgi:hypothetical protein
MKILPKIDHIVSLDIINFECSDSQQYRVVSMKSIGGLEVDACIILGL